MTAPLFRMLAREEAEAELHDLIRSIEGPIEDFERRADSYDLSPRELIKWERICDLRWLLSF